MQDGGKHCDGRELEDLVTRGLQAVLGLPPDARRAVADVMAAILPEAALQAGAGGVLEPAIPMHDETQDGDSTQVSCAEAVTLPPGARAAGALLESQPGASCSGGTGGPLAGGGTSDAAAAASGRRDKKEAARLAAVRAAAERAIAGAVIKRPMVGPGLVLVARAVVRRAHRDRVPPPFCRVQAG